MEGPPFYDEVFMSNFLAIIGVVGDNAYVIFGIGNIQGKP